MNFVEEFFNCFGVWYRDFVIWFCYVGEYIVLFVYLEVFDIKGIEGFNFCNDVFN